MRTPAEGMPAPGGARSYSEYAAALEGRLARARRRGMLRAAAAVLAAGAGTAAAVAGFLGPVSAAIEHGIFAAAALVTTVSLTVSPATYFLKKRHDAHSEKAQATVNVILELAHTLVALDRSRFRRDLVSVTAGGKRFCFVNRDLNHDFYDSLASSGKLNFLERGLQQLVQDAFSMIKMHNLYTDAVMEALCNGDRRTKGVVRKCKWLEESEVVMRRGIPRIMASLEKSLRA